MYLLISLCLFLVVRAIGKLKAKRNARKQAATAATARSTGVPGPPVALLASPSRPVTFRKIVSRCLTSELAILKDGGLAKELFSGASGSMLANGNVRPRSHSDTSAVTGGEGATAISVNR
jgi:hypothetical protein